MHVENEGDGLGTHGKEQSLRHQVVGLEVIFVTIKFKF